MLRFVDYNNDKGVDSMLAENLRALRLAYKVSQKELAASIGLDYKRYNHYETGRSEPDTETLCVLADYFHVSVDYLLGREEKKKEPITTSDDGLDEELRNFIEKLKGLDEETLLAIEKLVDSIISQRGQ